MKYKTDIKRICHLAWPAIIQEAMNTIVTYVDTAMVGAMGATASAASWFNIISDMASRKHFSRFWGWGLSSMCSS